MASSGPSSTTAELVYMVKPPNGVKAFQNINADPKTGERPKNFSRIQKEVEIENLRGKEDFVSLDTAGFQLFNRPSKHKAFTNDAEIEQEYYPESIEYIKEITGASRVVIFDHSKLSLPTFVGLELTIIHPNSNPTPSSWRDRRFA
jgi:hypothetical protein